MGWPGRRRAYDRGAILERAARARAKGNAKKAVALYEQVLAHEPGNRELHRRVAPLLAAAGRPADAWTSYRAAIAGLERAGFLDQAVGVLREAAAGALRRERAVWEQLARVEVARGRPHDAHRALVEGRRQFRARRDRADAIRLLAAARRLAPHHFAANYDLAGLLARAGERPAAARILEGLCETARGRELRRARGRLLRLRPSPGAAWRWLRSFRGGGAPPRRARLRCESAGVHASPRAGSRSA